jgi:hypothetical protein
VTAVRCADASRAAGEPLAATATTAEHWLLVEVRGGWSRDVATSDALPGAARLAVGRWLDETPRSRLLFLRRPSRTSGAALAFVVHAPEAGGSLRRLELAALDDLADADLARDGALSGAQLVLVCGHGSRDACCARRGTAVYGALAAGLAEEELWLSSHQGGHRFAANVVILPTAVQLGRVEPDEAERVVGQVLQGRIDLERYRGRTCHDPLVQAADYAVRAATGLTGSGDLRLADTSGSTARFLAADGAEYAVEVSERPGPAVPVSCGLEPEPGTVLTGRLATVRGATRPAGTPSP